MGVEEGRDACVVVTCEGGRDIKVERRWKKMKPWFYHFKQLLEVV